MGTDNAVVYKLENVTGYGVPKTLSCVGLHCPLQLSAYIELRSGMIPGTIGNTTT